MRLLIGMILVPLFLCSQSPGYSISSIPEVLTKGANAVVRIEHRFVDVPHIKEMNMTYKKVVTVLNKKGNSDVGAYVHYDGSVRIRKISAVVYDKFGNKIKTYKKSDFTDVSAVSGFSLYEDSRVLYMEYTPIDYPYTVEYTYESTSANTAYLPFWYPIKDYEVSTEKSIYEIQFGNATGGLIEKTLNFEGYDIKTDRKEHHLKFEANAIGAVKHEQLAPNFRYWAPRLMLAPVQFYYEGYQGNNGDWESLGKWMYKNLIQGRDELPETTIQKIKSLTTGVQNPIEKAKIVYDYVQKNTRYVSVQEGIGGLRPISALEVDKVKYGDCKGLTNYTKALLKAVGVQANYVRVFAKSEYQGDINEDFPSFVGQSNHVILNIPQKGKEPVWLECTSQTMPFGFLGDFTDDRYVFEISPNSGKIVKTPSYSNAQNKSSIEAKCGISPSGGLTGELTRTSLGIDYDNIYWIKDEKTKDQEDYYKKEWGSINGLTIVSMSFDNNRDKIQFSESLKVTAENYGSHNGDRLFMMPNIFAQNTFVPKRYRNRQLPFEVIRGFQEESSMELTLPKGYTIEGMPNAVSIQNKFGSYDISYELKDTGNVVVNRELLIKKGRYPKEEYAAYRQFRQKVTKNDQSKLVLVKESSN